MFTVATLRFLCGVHSKPTLWRSQSEGSNSMGDVKVVADLHELNWITVSPINPFLRFHPLFSVSSHQPVTALQGNLLASYSMFHLAPTGASMGHLDLEGVLPVKRLVFQLNSTYLNHQFNVYNDICSAARVLGCPS